MKCERTHGPKKGRYMQRMLNIHLVQVAEGKLKACKPRLRCRHDKCTSGITSPSLLRSGRSEKEFLTISAQMEPRTYRC